MRGPDRQPVAVQNIDRRSFLFTAAGIVIGTRRARAQSAVTRPVVSEKACPLETIAPVAADGHSGLAVCESRRVPAPSRSSFGFMVALLQCH